MIIVLDYGMGNVGSIKNMLKKIGTNDVMISSDKEDIKDARGLILPGVGAFDAGMRALDELNLINSLNDYVINQKKPILGICLGMQLLGHKSEEGQTGIKGLGYIDFENKKLSLGQYELRVPHMGWDYVDIKKDSTITKGIVGEQRYYFVHSYHAVCKNEEDVLMTCRYGIDITAAVQKENVYGVQFHPEKSHKYGMRLLANFVEECS